MIRRKPTLLLLMATLLLLPTLPAAADDWMPNPCRQTANVALTACKNDVRDDFFTQLGACLNLSDEDEAAECSDDAEEARIEDSALCREIRGARLELCERLGEFRYDPEIDPADFLSPDEIAASPNPYFPLVPGNEWVYENEDETITVTVLDETIDILGIECVVVHDVVVDNESGDAIEDTHDWYTQDLAGNVWYMGEIALNYEDGRLTDIDGSWKGGEDYAKPGIQMQAAPYPGQVYRQEFLLREAEDWAEVVAIDADESTSVADCNAQCLQTLEGTPVEPDAAEFKFYAPGIGLILEQDLESGDRTELVSFTPGPMP